MSFVKSGFLFWFLWTHSGCNLAVNIDSFFVNYDCDIVIVSGANLKDKQREIIPVQIYFMITFYTFAAQVLSWTKKWQWHLGQLLECICHLSLSWVVNFIVYNIISLTWRLVATHKMNLMICVNFVINQHCQ